MKYLISLTLCFILCACEDTSNGSPVVAPLTRSDIGTDQINIAESHGDIDKTLKAKVNQRGLYRLVRSGGVINDSRTGTGKAMAKPVIQLINSTQRIPIILGAQMYLQFRIWPLPDRPAYVDLRRVLKHPKITLPDGSVSMGSDYMIKTKISANQAIGYTGYGLDENYELVEGDWIFEIWYRDKKMIEQKFTTYRPNRDEITALEPVLTLGNSVLSKIESTEKPGERHNWPRIVLGKEEVKKNPN